MLHNGCGMHGSPVSVTSTWYNCLFPVLLVLMSSMPLARSFQCGVRRYTSFYRGTMRSGCHPYCRRRQKYHLVHCAKDHIPHPVRTAPARRELEGGEGNGRLSSRCVFVFPFHVKVTSGGMSKRCSIPKQSNDARLRTPLMSRDYTMNDVLRANVRTLGEVI